MFFKPGITSLVSNPKIVFELDDNYRKPINTVYFLNSEYYPSASIPMDIYIGDSGSNVDQTCANSITDSGFYECPSLEGKYLTL